MTIYGAAICMIKKVSGSLWYDHPIVFWPQRPIVRIHEYAFVCIMKTGNKNRDNARFTFAWHTNVTNKHADARIEIIQALQFTPITQVPSTNWKL